MKRWLKKAYKKRHTVLMWFWIAMLPVSIFTDLKTSVTFLVILSIYANIEASASAKEASNE